MVVWSEYYRFPADRVEAIWTSDGSTGSHPYTLTVYLNSGKTLSICYTDKQSRKAAMLDLSRQIDREKRSDTEKIHNLLYILRDSVSRIDKRQLRIWRQLKALLDVKVEDESDGE